MQKYDKLEPQRCAHSTQSSGANLPFLCRRAILPNTVIVNSLNTHNTTLYGKQRSSRFFEENSQNMRSYRLNNKSCDKRMYPGFVNYEKMRKSENESSLRPQVSKI